MGKVSEGQVAVLVIGAAGVVWLMTRKPTGEQYDPGPPPPPADWPTPVPWKKKGDVDPATCKEQMLRYQRHELLALVAEIQQTCFGPLANWQARWTDEKKKIQDAGMQNTQRKDVLKELAVLVREGEKNARGLDALILKWAAIT